MTPGRRRTCAAVTLAVWCGAMTVYGWLGPLTGSVAWYANIILAIILVRWAHGHPAGRAMGRTAFILALTAFLPSCVYDVEQDGKLHAHPVYGPAVILWVLSFAIAAWTTWWDASPKGF